MSGGGGGSVGKRNGIIKDVGNNICTAKKTKTWSFGKERIDVRLRETEKLGIHSPMPLIKSIHCDYE